MTKNLKKKVLLINHSDGLGGGTKSFIDLVISLQKDFEVTTMFTNKDGYLSKIIQSLNVVSLNDFDFNIPNFSLYFGGIRILGKTFIINIYRLLVDFRKIMFFFKNSNFDFYFLNSIVMAPLLLFIPKNKGIIYCRENISNNFNLWFFKFFLYLSSAKVIFLANVQSKRFNLKKSRILVLPDTYYPERYSSSNIPSLIKNSSFNILFLGGSDKIKGLSILLSAFNILDPYLYHLIVAGKVSKEFIQTNKFFTKFLNQGSLTYIDETKEISYLFKNSSCLIFPSQRPHQSRPAIEAAYHCIPVIISDFYETSDFFINFYNCITFKFNSSNDLAKKIANLYLDKTLRTKIVNNNNIMFEINNSYENFSKRLINFVSDIL